MNKFALSLIVLAGLSTASFASQRNQDPDFIFGSKSAVTTSYSTQAAAVVTGSQGNKAFAKLLENMKRQESNR